MGLRLEGQSMSDLLPTINLDFNLLSHILVAGKTPHGSDPLESYTTMCDALHLEITDTRLTTLNVLQLMRTISIVHLDSDSLDAWNYVSYSGSSNCVIFSFAHSSTYTVLSRRLKLLHSVLLVHLKKVL